MPELQIKLTKARYEMKLNSHSQFVRWMRAATCFCANNMGSIDPNCPSCLGRGYVYSHQTTMEVYGENSPHCGENVWTNMKPIVSVESVYRGDSWKRPYTVVDFVDDNRIRIAANPNMPSLPAKDEFIKVDYTYSLEKLVSHGTATYLGGGVLSIPLPTSQSVEFSEITGDITRVIELKNVTKNLTYDMQSTFKNQVVIDIVSQDEPDSNDVWDVTVKFIPPWSFLINQISERMRFEDAYIATEGDASMTVLYPVYIGVGDVVVQCIGEQRASSVMQITEAGVDELPAFDVTKILRFEDGTGEQYRFGIDYVIRQGNQIVWLPTGHRPVSKYTVLYLYHPAFKIFNIKPTVRTPENLKMPRRASLTVYDKVNVSEDLHRLKEGGTP